MDLAAMLGRSHDWRRFLIDDFLPQCMDVLRQSSKQIYDQKLVAKTPPWEMDATVWPHLCTCDKTLCYSLVLRWDCYQSLPNACLMLARYQINKLLAGQPADKHIDLVMLQHEVVEAA
ncbi:MAG: hypothetical protein V4519_01800 [Patescibacteria group bacterium]